MQDGFVKLACCVPEVRVADVAHNAGATLALAREAAVRGAKVAVFPELGLTAYTCHDLFLQRRLLDAARDALLKLAEQTAALDTLLFVGLPLIVRDRLYNVAAALYGGQVLALIPKSHIPNYSEFYERRHFTPASEAAFTEVELGGRAVPFGTDILLCHRNLPELKVGCEICEDLWVPNPPSIRHALAGATVIVNLSASDEIVAKDEYRRELVSGQSARLVCAYAYASAGAGESTQDLVYTGHSLLCENGGVLAELTTPSGLILSECDVGRLVHERRRMSTFGGVGGYREIAFGGALERTELTRFYSRTPFVPEDPARRAARCEKIFTLQSMGLQKRIAHTNAKCVVVGVSGGLDSTLALLVAARAMDLLGRPHSDVLAVTMPCFGTTKRTRSNAELLSEKLGCTLRCVNIFDAVNGHFSDIGHNPAVTDVTYENSQARERTQVLMDLAGEHGGFVVGTGDLSELALGWATYNGDHMSMYAVNTSVPKMLVRHLVDYEAGVCGDPELAAVLRDILATPVSPELLPAKDGEISQITEDLVGPYELHDFFLYYCVRWGFAPAKIYRLARYAFAGAYDDATILKWLKKFYWRFFSQQFKRSCLPDGPKVGSVTLSPRGDWRMPSDAVCAIWQEELETLE